MDIVGHPGPLERLAVLLREVLNQLFLWVRLPTCGLGILRPWVYKRYARHTHSTSLISSGMASWDDTICDEYVRESDGCILGNPMTGYKMTERAQQELQKVRVTFFGSHTEAKQHRRGATRSSR